MEKRNMRRFLMVAGAALLVGGAVPMAANGVEAGPTAGITAANNGAHASGVKRVHPVADGERHSSSPSPSMVGGHKATEDVPFIAALHVQSNQAFSCTSSVIAPEWILTAKHCVQDGTDKTFRIGSLQRSSGGQEANSQDIVLGPEGNDVALVKLDHKVDISEYAKVGDSDEVKVGTSEHVFGWGYENSDWTNLPEDLKTSSGKINQLDCGENFGEAFCLKNDGETSGGDSGGPAINDATGNILGVCSFGHKPTTGDGFGGYQTVVSDEVRSWIKDTAGV